MSSSTAAVERLRTEGVAEEARRLSREMTARKQIRAWQAVKRPLRRYWATVKDESVAQPSFFSILQLWSCGRASRASLQLHPRVTSLSRTTHANITLAALDCISEPRLRHAYPSILQLEAFSLFMHHIPSAGPGTTEKAVWRILLAIISGTYLFQRGRRRAPVFQVDAKQTTFGHRPNLGTVHARRVFQIIRRSESSQSSFASMSCCLRAGTASERGPRPTGFMCMCLVCMYNCV
jgi:hypothetical protein